MLGKFKSGQSRIPTNRTNSLEQQSGYDHFQATNSSPNSTILKPSKKIATKPSNQQQFLPPEKTAKVTHKLAPDPNVKKISSKNSVSSSSSASSSPSSNDNASNRGRSSTNSNTTNTSSSGYSTHSITSSSPAISSSDDEEARKQQQHNRSKSENRVERSSSNVKNNKVRYESKSSERALKPEKKNNESNKNSANSQLNKKSSSNVSSSINGKNSNNSSKTSSEDTDHSSNNNKRGTNNVNKSSPPHPAPELPPKKSSVTKPPDKKNEKKNNKDSNTKEKPDKNNISNQNIDDGKRNSVSSETSTQDETKETGDDDAARLKQILMSIEPGDLYHFTIARLSTQDPKIIDALRVLLPAIDVEKLAQLSTSTFNTSGSSGAGSTSGSRGVTSNSSNSSTSGDDVCNVETESRNSITEESSENSSTNVIKNEEIRDLMIKDKNKAKNAAETGSTDDVSSNCGASQASSKAPLSSLDFEEESEEVNSIEENHVDDINKPPKHHEIPENPNSVYCADVHYSNNMKQILKASQDCKVYMAEVRSKDSGKNSHTDSTSEVISTHSLISIIPKNPETPKNKSKCSDKNDKTVKSEISDKPKQVQHCVRCHKNFDIEENDDTENLKEEQKCKVSHPENMVIKLVEDKSGCDFKCMVCGKEFRLKVGYYEEGQNDESVTGHCLITSHTSDPRDVKFRKCGGAAKTCEENGCVEFYV